VNREPKTVNRELFGGGSGIRTHGPLRVSGFQDRCIKPLCHPSRICSEPLLRSVRAEVCHRRAGSQREAKRLFFVTELAAEKDGANQDRAAQGG
jgi:hypothetical protein